MRTLIVTAANEAFMPLLRGLVLSLQPWQDRPDTALACLDLGLEAASRSWVLQYAAHLVEPEWDLPVAPALREQHPHWRALTARPFLPRYFPGYDTYVWIDSDAWVQEHQALDWWVAAAQGGALAAAPESDRSYQRSEALHHWRTNRMRLCFGEEAAQRLAWDAYFNAGVYALRADAPHWSHWARHFRDALLATDGTLCCDQTALNHMLWTEELPVHPLPAICNWLCHLALPAWDPENNRWCEPLEPRRAIGIVHVTSTTKSVVLESRPGGLRFEEIVPRIEPPVAKPKVFIAWELGGGLGHIMRAAALAHEFVAAGNEVFVALRELGSSGLASWPSGTHLLQAPLAHPVPMLSDPGNYSEILFASGYHEPRALAALVVGWSTLIDMIDPVLVVADHAPTACLVARLAEIPLARIGNGFFAPPATRPFPAFRPHVDGDRLIAAEAQVLAAINVVAQSCALSFSSVAEALQPGLDLLTTWPELDHYAGVRPPDSVEFVGHERVSTPGPALEWPGHGKMRVLAYLKAHYGGYASVVSGLQQANAATVAYVQGGVRTAQPEALLGQILFRAEPFDPWPAVQACDVLICHAGGGLAAMALDAGKPVLMLPYNAEQSIYANQIQSLGAGMHVSESAANADFLAPLTQFLETPSYGVCARALSAKHRPQGDAIAQSVRKMLAFVAERAGR